MVEDLTILNLYRRTTNKQMLDRAKEFKNFSQDGLELTIDIKTGEVYASQRAIARMCTCEASTISRFLGVAQIAVTQAQIQTNSGLQGVALVDEDGIVACLKKYNPNTLGNFIKLGLRAVLQESVGYKHPTANIPQGGLSTSDIMTYAATALDLAFAGTGLNPNILTSLKLKQMEAIVPEIAPYLLESKALAITETAQEYQLLTPTEIGKYLNISAQAVNKKLVDLGYQVKNVAKHSKKDCSYVPIGHGFEFSDLTLATGGGKDNTTYQQLRWYESVISQLPN